MKLILSICLTIAAMFSLSAAESVAQEIIQFDIDQQKAKAVALQDYMKRSDMDIAGAAIYELRIQMLLHGAQNKEKILGVTKAGVQEFIAHNLIEDYQAALSFSKKFKKNPDNMYDLGKREIAQVEKDLKIVMAFKKKLSE